MDVGAWVKEHPKLTIVGVIIVGGALFMLVSSISAAGSSNASASVGSGATGGLDDASYQALLNYQAQTNATSAQANAQASSQSFQLAALQEQDQTAIAQANTAAQVANNQNAMQYQAAIAGITAQLQGLENTNLTTQNVAQISANENVAISQVQANENTTIAQFNSQVLMNASDNQTKLGVAQVNAWQKVATSQANSQMWGGIGSSLGSIFSLGGLF